MNIYVSTFILGFYYTSATEMWQLTEIINRMYKIKNKYESNKWHKIINTTR